eukprot:GILK01010878.1.p1 GENE.GILK01010878.1~~GILK01010878.1.p1  ORF type:complete len:258 (-),score=85.55 GILK01010878.1:63-809(-)
MADRDKLKELMKARQKESKEPPKLAKFNAAGQLVCQVCGTIVKSENVWPAHLVSRVHKEVLESLKVKAGLKAAATPSVPAQTSSDSSEEDSEAEQGPEAPTVEVKADTAAEEEEEAGPKSAIPAGFFDDPVADAKARGLEDPNVKRERELAEEMKLFNEQIERELAAQESKQEQEDEEKYDDRFEEDLEEQRLHLKRLEEIKQRTEQMKRKATAVEDKSSKRQKQEVESSDDSDFDPDVNWRSKAFVR